MVHNPPPARIVLAGAALAAGLLLSTQISAGSQRGGKNFLKIWLEQANVAYQADDLEAALDGYRRILFADPRSSKARKRVKEIQRKLAGRLVDEAEELWEEDPGRALGQLRRASASDRKARIVKAAFKKRGYTWYQGEWRTEEEIKRFEKTDAMRREQRRKEIGLPENMKIIRRGVFRFYTDLDLKAAKSVLTQMMDSMDTHYRKYLEVMGVFDLRYPTEGLDVVLFTTREDYIKHTRSQGTAGVYFPGRGVGFFFRGSRGFNFPTMLHEMTHQLNDKVLGAIGISGWFEEGIAEYFGAGYLTQAGRKVALGRVDASRKASFKGMVVGGRTMPLKDFLSRRRAELSGQFYAQSWAFAHYLMEGPMPGRLILYDFISRGKKGRQQGAERGVIDAREFEAILNRYEMSLAELEKRFIDYHRHN